MSTTLSQLASDLRTELRIDPNDKIWPLATKERYLNRAYVKVQRDGQYRWRQNEVEYEFSLAGGQEKYELSSAITADDFTRLDYIQLRDSLTNLRNVSLEIVRTRGSTGTGQPNEYFIFGTTIGFYPIPDAAYTVLILYRRKLAKMTSSQAMLLPDDFADAIVKYAAYLAWSSPRGERGKAEESKGDYEELMSELKVSYLLQDSSNLKFGYQRSTVNNRSDKALYYD